MAAGATKRQLAATGARLAIVASAVKRVLIDWDWGASGIWTILSAEELSAPGPAGSWYSARSLGRGRAAPAVERQALRGSPRCTPGVERSWRGAVPPSGTRQRRRDFAGDRRRLHVARGEIGGVDTTPAWPRLRGAVHHLDRCLAMGAASLEPQRPTLTNRAVSVASARAAASTKTESHCRPVWPVAHFRSVPAASRSGSANLVAVDATKRSSVPRGIRAHDQLCSECRALSNSNSPCG